MVKQSGNVLLAVFVLAALVCGGGCRQQSDRAGKGIFALNGWGKVFGKSGGGPKGGSPLQRPAVSYFWVWLIDVPAQQDVGDAIYETLNEGFSGGRYRSVLGRNGLRLGVGKMDQWPAIKQRLDAAGGQLSGRRQLTIGLLQPMRILADEMRASRTLFYYDSQGRGRGEDLGDCSIGILIAASGSGNGGPLMVKLAPELQFSPMPSRWQVVEGQPQRVWGSERRVLTELMVRFPLAKDEFALLGPRETDLADSLIGSQLLLIESDSGRVARYCLICGKTPKDMAWSENDTDEHGPVSR